MRKQTWRRLKACLFLILGFFSLTTLALPGITKDIPTILQIMSLNNMVYMLHENVNALGWSLGQLTLNRIPIINKLCGIEVPMYVLILKSQSTFLNKCMKYIYWHEEFKEKENNDSTLEEKNSVKLTKKFNIERYKVINVEDATK